MDTPTKELILAYLEKAERKLEVARRWFNAGDWEDSVSRAYYAAFHAVQALLVSEGQKTETHRGAITLFNLLFVKTGRLTKNMGRYLANLKDDREASDYEVFSFIEEDTARHALEEAEAFVQASRAYLHGLGMGG